MALDLLTPFIALFFAPEQTCCSSCMWQSATMNECLALDKAFEYSPKWWTSVLIACDNGWDNIKLLPSQCTSCAHHTTVDQFTVVFKAVVLCSSGLLVYGGLFHCWHNPPNAWTMGSLMQYFYMCIHRRDTNFIVSSHLHSQFITFQTCPFHNSFFSAQ